MRELKLLTLDKIIETEEHDNHLAIKLAEHIINIGFWTVPIAIDSLTYGIMDGHLSNSLGFGLSKFTTRP